MEASSIIQAVRPPFLGRGGGEIEGTNNYVCKRGEDSLCMSEGGHYHTRVRETEESH